MEQLRLHCGAGARQRRGAAEAACGRAEPDDVLALTLAQPTCLRVRPVPRCVSSCLPRRSLARHLPSSRTPGPLLREGHHNPAVAHRGVQREESPATITIQDLTILLGPDRHSRACTLERDLDTDMAGRDGKIHPVPALLLPQYTALLHVARRRDCGWSARSNASRCDLRNNTHRHQSSDRDKGQGTTQAHRIHFGNSGRLRNPMPDLFTRTVAPVNG